MKSRIIKTPETICESKNGIHNYFAWPSVTRLSDGTLAAVCSGYRIGHLCPFGKTVIFYSKDEGKSWTAPTPVIDTPLDDRDGGIAVNKNGVTVITSFNNSVETQNGFSRKCVRTPERQAYIDAYLELMKTTDGEEKYLGSTYVMSNDGYVFGEVKRMPVTAPHGPAPLKDGSFLYVGRYFDDKGINHLGCYKLFENGKFEFLCEIENITDTENVLSCEPHTVELPDGKIIVHIRAQKYESGGSQKLFTLYQCESTDGGKSFTTPHRILENDLSGAPAHLLYHSSGVLISVYGCRKDPFGIHAILSTDGGESWSEEQILCNDLKSADIGYPASVELENGDILTVFYTRESDGGETKIIRENEKSPSVIQQIIWKIEK